MIIYWPVIVFFTVSIIALIPIIVNIVREAQPRKGAGYERK